MCRQRRLLGAIAAVTTESASSCTVMTFIVKCAPVLQEWRFCCCSCSLRAASIVLAWIFLVTNVTQLVSCVIYVTHPMHVYDLYDRTEKAEIVTIFLSILVGGLILNGILLYGIHNKKPLYMLPYLVLELIGLVLFGIIVLVTTVLALPQTWGKGLAVFVVGTGLLAVGSFLWDVLYSYYRQLEEEKLSPHGIVNFTYGMPTGQVQITTCPETEKTVVPYSAGTKLGPELA